MAYQGHMGKIALGTVAAAYLNSWDIGGIVNQLIAKDLFQRKFQNFDYGEQSNDPIEIAGYLHTGVVEPEELIDPAQELLRGYAEAAQNVPHLRLYIGEGNTQFYHATPGATVKIENYWTGKVDRKTGLVPISFTLRVSDGYMSPITGYYNGIDVSFAHVVGAANDTISKTGGTNFAGLGFLAGANLIVEGSTSNDLSLTIKAGGVAANVLTVNEDTITTEIAGDSVSLISFPII